MDVHNNRSFELPIAGQDFERVSVFGLSVQRLLHNQTPLALVLLDDGKLAQRVAVCMRDEEQTDLKNDFSETDADVMVDAEVMLSASFLGII